MSDKSWISDQQQVAAAQNVKERDYWLSRLSGEWERVSFPADVADTGAESTGNFRSRGVEGPIVFAVGKTRQRP